MSNSRHTLLGKTDKEIILSEFPLKFDREQIALFLYGQGNISFALPTVQRLYRALDIIRATLLRSALASSRSIGLANFTDLSAVYSRFQTKGGSVEEEREETIERRLSGVFVEESRVVTVE